MHSFLILSKDKTLASNKTEEILDENKISAFDRNFFDFEKAAGIEEIKKILGSIHLKPFESEKKAIILNLDFGITTESQNALLKALEEPPANTIIILQAKTLEDFLPTIISRCKIYEIRSESNLSEDFSSEVERILNSTEGQKMEIAAEFGKDRETALNFVEQTVISASSLAKKENPKKYLKILESLSEAYSTLKYSNVNSRFILENFLLSLV